MKKSYFIITVDTEGDNLWNKVQRSTGSRTIHTENAKWLSRFQSLCEKYSLVPTYLTNYEMASDDFYVGNAKEWQDSGMCEVGMHMHSWNCPPLYELKYHRYSHNPYAGDYPEEVVSDKIRYLTSFLEKQFGSSPTSHRGGRWYVDSFYLSELSKLGYLVDCSVTAGISWKEQIGHQIYGNDYSKFPSKPYFINPNDISKKAKGGMLEIQPTIVRKNRKEKMWLRPNGRNRDDLLRIMDIELPYYEFMIHSSELMPGGSPTFKTNEDIDRLYADMETLFEVVSDKKSEGIALTKYAKLLNEAKK